MISDLLFNLEKNIKRANEEITSYLANLHNYDFDQKRIIELIKKNEDHIKYLKNFRLQPGYDLPPNKT